jgi:hypothetical protein
LKQAASTTEQMVVVTIPSETSVDFQRNTRRYIPEDGTLHDHRCENLKSYKQSVTLNAKLENLSEEAGAMP